MSEAKNIHEAINAIMQEVGYVKKQRSAGLNYSFAGEAALIEALRPTMVENGVYCYVKEISDVSRIEYTTAKGSQMVNVALTAKIEFTHAPSQTSIIVTSRGEGSDSGDKATNKAATGAYKYALRQTFCIETGDDPDKDPSRPAATPAQAKAQSQPTKTIVPAQNGVMTYEDACAVVGGSDKKKYGDLTTEELSAKSVGISKALKKAETTAEQRAELNRKFEAIGIIMKHRNGGN